jgi:hypothetical protein
VPHLFHGFYPKPVSTNDTAVIPFSLQPNQFNVIKMAMVWWKLYKLVPMFFNQFINFKPVKVVHDYYNTDFLHNMKEI